VAVSDQVVEAAKRGEEAAVLAWLDSGGRADATYERGKVSGFTLLIAAARYGHERVVDLLLQRGAEVNLQDSDSWTALMYAARYGHERVVELLLQHGADVNLRSPPTKPTSGWSSCCCSAARRSTCRPAAAGPR